MSRRVLWPASRHGRRAGSKRVFLAGLVAALCVSFNTQLRAEDTESAGENADRAAARSGSSPSSESEAINVSPRGTNTASPGIDALLQLPSSYLGGAGRRVAGAGKDEWLRRFAKAERALREADEALARSKRDLDQVAEGGGGSQWSVATPGGGSGGGGPTNSPLSFKLRQDLARNREALDEAERAVRELKIEADLAGVPSEWRGDGDGLSTIQRTPRIPDTLYR